MRSTSQGKRSLRTLPFSLYEWGRGLIVLDARNARLGGGLTFLAQLVPPLARAVEARGERLEVLAGPAPTRASRLRRRVALTQAQAILHAGNRATISPSARQVVCVRDRLRLPLETEPPALSLRERARRGLLLHALRVADEIVVPSASMLKPVREMQRSHAFLKEKPLHVIHHGRPPWPTPAPRAFGEEVRFFYPAHAGWHKNFPLLAALLERLSSTERSRLRLTLTALPTQQIGERNLGEMFSPVLDLVDFIGPVENSLLHGLYDQHDVLIFPSLVESFGLPLLEAMTMGMPVIASDLEWARELCGEGATLIDPAVLDDWLEAVKEVIESGRRENPKGVEQVLHFDWNDSAELYANLLVGKKTGTPTPSVSGER